MTGMLARARRALHCLTPTLLGLALGVGAGGVWWLFWGCHYCDPSGLPWPKLIFTAVVGTGLGAFLGREYVSCGPREYTLEDLG